ncbi:electron transport protein [Metabacillus endolithicus]|uniref:Electron transport protein n=1 Tax=Metabacillus endolithicus TaxID=1535204 RepID=A0ABW5BY61_9BACI|nr:electron transport protein [Metabacillus endolithicus]UPG64119.1 electron transport protein [Metabacillus endolithicus]
MRKAVLILSVFIIGLIGVVTYFSIVGFQYAYLPPDEVVHNKESDKLIDVKNVSYIQDESSEELIELGKKLFYEETFGNEVFFSDIMGMFDGTFTLMNVGKAIVKLNGKGTDNLLVEAAETVKIGDRTIEKGELIETGLDVPKGAVTPLGVKFVYEKGNIKAGISCAVCHSSLNEQKEVVHGMTNSDLAIGLLVAMSSNSASYFSHTEMESIKEFVSTNDRLVESTKGGRVALPDIKKLEDFVDREVMKWPKGSNDTTIDFKNNPVQILDVYTKGDHPYGWSGQGQIGPFKGLSAAINNAHAQNMDTLSQTTISNEILNIDKELYLGTILQNAARKKYRYDPESGEKPSEFFAKVDPTPGAEGVNTLIPAPTYPRPSFVTSVGLFSSSDGYKAWEQQNAMSAFMNSLYPPKTNIKSDEKTVEEGRRVFVKAGCITCHGGNYLTNNKLIPTEEIKTDNSRAKGFQAAENYFSLPSIYDPSTPVPLPENPVVMEIPLTKEQNEQLRLGWAQGGTNGAYKTTSLIGLNWSAPYLHDGGVAVGKDLVNEVGVPGTILSNKKPDPRNSLLAMIDSSLRKKVIKTNNENHNLKTAHVSGKGHEFWVDSSTGFTKEQQQALIDYLLKVSD